MAEPSMIIDVLEVQLSKIQLAPGDKIVIKIDRALQRDQLERIGEMVERWALGHDTLILDNTANIEIVTKK